MSYQLFTATGLGCKGVSNRYQQDLALGEIQQKFLGLRIGYGLEMLLDNQSYDGIPSFMDQMAYESSQNDQYRTVRLETEVSCKRKKYFGWWGPLVDDLESQEAVVIEFVKVNEKWTAAVRIFRTEEQVHKEEIEQILKNHGFKKPGS